MKQPYVEKLINENTRLRKFSSSTPEDQLVWHRDRQDRVVKVIGGKGWMFQRDGSIPVQISPGTIFEVNANEWHRIIKGEGDLVLKIIEEKKDQNKDGKNDFDDVRIARMLSSNEYESIDQVKKDHPELFERESELDIFESLFLLHEKKKKKKRKKKSSKKDKDKPLPRQYGAPSGSKREKLLKKASALYKKGDVKGAAKIRQNMEKSHMAESKIKIRKSVLLEMINDAIEEEKLDIVLQELEDRLDEKRKKKKSGKSPKGLSKAVKKSLDKKADRRCLTRGSVYAEFRKGLSAFLSSGSRKGMTAHQWAHARVNSANPSKKWAVVKKRKKCPKKKKK